MKRKISHIYIPVALIITVIAAMVLTWIIERNGAAYYPHQEDERMRDSVASQVDSIDRRLAGIAEAKKYIDQYLSTHGIIEDGFEYAVRYDHRIKKERDSLESLVMSLRKYLERTATIMDLQRLPKPELRLLYGVEAKDEYDGDVDFRGLPDGQGFIATANGDFYEGEWSHGKRYGTGVGRTTDGKLRVGEWKNDKYLGERITYTAERTYGIDISRYQHEQGRKRFSIDWKNLAITSLGKISKKKIMGEVNYPISFIYIKSTEGTNIRNRYFAADYANSRKYGYRTGAYHFFSTKSGGQAQARFFCKNSKYQKGDLAPVLDVEPSDKQIRQMGGAQAMFKQIRAWVNYVESVWHVRPILYISQSFVNKYLPLAPDLMKNYDVWIARYGEYKPDVNLVYWQLCPDGRVRGIRTEVDINVMIGS